MDFALSEEQRELQKWAHDFAENEIRPVAAEYDETEEFPWPVVKKGAEIGLYGFELYANYQADTTGLSLPIIMEEICWGCAGIGLALFGTGLPLSALAAAGTPEQLLQWAPRMFGKVDGGWVLNGTKIFATNGGIADVHIVVATVDPELGIRGQASFIVSREDHKGIKQGKKERKLGIRASHTAEVLLEDCFVPGENLIGGQDKLDAKLERAKSGAHERGSVALRTFEITRPLVAIQAVGIARAAVEFAVQYAKERHTFGVPIVQHQGVAFQLADMAMEVDAARLLTHRAAWMAGSGQPFTRAEGSMSKLKAGEVAVRVTEQAVQVCGGYGYVKDLPVEKWYRDSKIYTLFEGTSEIQRLVISRALVGT
jgi:acyl-CoA dehydrogenase